MLRDRVSQLMDNEDTVVCTSVIESVQSDLKRCAQRTGYHEMPGTRAGCLIDGALDCPGAALLHKAPNLVRTEVWDEHLVTKWHNLKRKKKTPTL